MNARRPSDESINSFLKASEDLMQMGINFTENIDSALKEFKKHFDLILKTHFVEKGASEMLADSFGTLESKVKDNLEGIANICIEGGQWYSFYLGTAMGRRMNPPNLDSADVRSTNKSKTASQGST